MGKKRHMSISKKKRYKIADRYTNMEWEKFKESVKSKCKKYGPMVLKYGIPIALGIATGGATLPASIGGVVVAASKALKLPDLSKEQTEHLGTFLGKYDKGAFEILKQSIPEDMLDKVKDFADEIQAMRDEIDMQRDLSGILSQWSEEFGPEMRREFELTRDQLAAMKTDLMGALNRIEEKINTIEASTINIDQKADTIQVGVAKILILMQSNGNVKQVEQSIENLLNIISEIAPGSENDPFKSLDVSQISKGDLSALEQVAKALEDLPTAKKKQLGTSFMWFRLARLMYKLEKLEYAESFSRQTLLLDPKFAVAWNNFGVLMQTQKKFEEAERCYRNALNIDPETAKTWTGLGILMKDQKKFEEAERYLRKALDIDPKFAVAWNNFGVLMKDQKKFEEAERYLRKALDIDPKNALTIYNIACLYGLKNEVKNVIKYLKESISIDNNSIKIFKNGTLHDKTFKEMAKTDTDFDLVRNDPEFKRLLS